MNKLQCETIIYRRRKKALSELERKEPQIGMSGHVLLIPETCHHKVNKISVSITSPHELCHRVIIHHTSSKGVKTFSRSPRNYIMKEMYGICPFPNNPE